jgi:putative FmdB family regulatory protein
MPNYEYECQTCGVHFERTQKFTDEPMQICPECGGKVRKLFFPVGIIFKGSGWYKTDHGSGAIPPAENKDAAPAAKTEPAKAETAKTDASKSDSGKSDSAKSEPAKSETKKTEATSDKK